MSGAFRPTRLLARGEGLGPTDGKNGHQVPSGNGHEVSMMVLGCEVVPDFVKT